MRLALSVLFAVMVSGPAGRAQDTCAIEGISASDVGQGTGVYSSSHLSLTWDEEACGLRVAIDTFTCCNVYPVRHLLVVGQRLLAKPRPLGRRFLPGSELLVELSYVFGPFQGTSSLVDVPSSPALIGRSFAAQAVPVFFTTISLSTDYGITQGVVFTFE